MNPLINFPVMSCQALGSISSVGCCDASCLVWFRSWLNQYPWCSMTFEEAKTNVKPCHWDSLYLIHPSPTVFRCEPFDKSTKSMFPDVCTNHNKQSSAISVRLSVKQYDYFLYSTYLLYVRAHSANVKNPPMAFLWWLVLPYMDPWDWMGLVYIYTIHGSIKQIKQM